MRRKTRGTLQINEDVKRLFMLAKPLNVTSSDFLRGLVLLHAREVREASEKSQSITATDGTVPPDVAEDRHKPGRYSCLGRPRGAKDLRPRTRRTKRMLARQGRGTSDIQY
jgi:hypothetical protein